VFIYRFEPDWSGVVAVESVDPDWFPLVGTKIADSFFGETSGQELYKQGRIQVTADIYAAGLSKCHINLLAQLQVRANLVVPIVQGQQLWGLLVANQCSRPRQWQQLEIHLLQQLANQLAIALHQSQLYEQTQLQVQREQALNRVIQTIRNSLDLTTIFSTATFETANLLQADRAQIVQYLPQRKLWLVVADYRQAPDSPDALGLKIPDADNQIAAQLKRLEVIRISDASTCADEINRGLAPAFPGAWLLVPLHFGSLLWGSLSLVRNRQPSPWQESEVELTRAVADQLAIAIQQSTLFEQVQTELTERKQAEEALRESKERYRSVIAAMQEGIVLQQADGRIVACNASAESILGLSADQMMGRTSLDSQWGAIHEDGSPFPGEKHPAMVTLRTGKPCSNAIMGVHKPNRLLNWISINSQPLFSLGETTPYAVVTSFSDVTERKQAEQKIRQQAALLDVATDAILVRDLENKILFWNKSAERLYGWKAEEALGKNVNELLYKEISPQLDRALHTVNLAGEWYGELHKVTKEGKEIVVETRWTLVRDERGNPKSILTVDTDITQKKQLEAQFLRAQRLESLGTLASGIAHDLNNVLAPILMSAQLLQMRYPDERERQLLSILENNAKRGANLVKQVLSFARGVEGKHTTVQISNLVKEIQHIVAATFPKSIEFYSEIASDLWNISGDATQLHQVLMNLIVNARDAMPDGGTLSISAENFFVDEHYARMNLEATVGSYIVITVADTGSGIIPEVEDRIFEPFFTTKEVGKGTGLGLSTVMGIIKSHSGFVSVDSQVGKGSQFKVYLPAMNSMEATQTMAGLGLPTGHGELILVVDDEATLREITKTSLETYNYKVLTASDGIETIALYVQHKAEISLVLMNMMMPDMDGATTIRTLQKINPQLKIIALSGLASNDQVAFAAGSSVKAFLSKPYALKELLNTINSVLNA
jgi:PAS domain S-box-containing protein